MNAINTEQFLRAFADEWQARLSSQRDELMSAYVNNKTWTDYMLSHGGFLNGVMERLRPLVGRLEYWKEVYTIDALFVGGEALFKNDLNYPSQLHVLIEHENDQVLEEEMWKLIFWRSPLKVLICYDWHENKKTTGKRRTWLSDKLGVLRKMLETANQRFPESNETEYVFIIGNRENEQSDVTWKWASPNQLQPINIKNG